MVPAKASPNLYKIIKKIIDIIFLLYLSQKDFNGSKNMSVRLFESFSRYPETTGEKKFIINGNTKLKAIIIYIIFQPTLSAIINPKPPEKGLPDDMLQLVLQNLYPFVFQAAPLLYKRQ